MLPQTAPPPFDSLRSLRAFDSRPLNEYLSSHFTPFSPACHELAQRVEWRRRESNACLPSVKRVAVNNLRHEPDVLSVNCQCESATDCLQLSRLDPRLQLVILAWDELSEQ